MARLCSGVEGESEIADIVVLSLTFLHYNLAFTIALHSVGVFDFLEFRMALYMFGMAIYPLSFEFMYFSELALSVGILAITFDTSAFKTGYRYHYHRIFIDVLACDAWSS